MHSCFSSWHCIAWMLCCGQVVSLLHHPSFPHLAWRSRHRSYLNRRRTLYRMSVRHRTPRSTRRSRCRRQWPVRFGRVLPSSCSRRRHLHHSVKSDSSSMATTVGITLLRVDIVTQVGRRCRAATVAATSTRQASHTGTRARCCRCQTPTVSVTRTTTLTMAGVVTVAAQAVPQTTVVCRRGIMTVTMILLWYRGRNLSPRRQLHRLRVCLRLQQW